jgi:hypothetical protein
VVSGQWSVVRGQVSGVRCQVSGFSFQVSGVRCQVSGVRCQVSGIRGRRVSELAGLYERPVVSDQLQRESQLLKEYIWGGFVGVQQDLFWKSSFSLENVGL